VFHRFSFVSSISWPSRPTYCFGVYRYFALANARFAGATYSPAHLRKACKSACALEETRVRRRRGLANRWSNRVKSSQITTSSSVEHRARRLALHSSRHRGECGGLKRSFRGVHLLQHNDDNVNLVRTRSFQIELQRSLLSLLIACGNASMLACFSLLVSAGRTTTIPAHVHLMILVT
jgi:hypothetical protein